MTKPKLKLESETDDIYNYSDSIIMAIMGTNNYDVSQWWLSAFKDAVHDIDPELDDRILEVINYLDEAVFVYCKT